MKQPTCMKITIWNIALMELQCTSSLIKCSFLSVSTETTLFGSYLFVNVIHLLLIVGLVARRALHASMIKLVFQVSVKHFFCTI